MARPAAAVAVRATASAIRTCVFTAFADGIEASQVAVTRGANLVRMGRWAIANTSNVGILVAVTATEEANGYVCYLGPAATIRGIVPSAVRTAWIANQFGEVDTDP